MSSSSEALPKSKAVGDRTSTDETLYRNLALAVVEVVNKKIASMESELQVVNRLITALTSANACTHLSAEGKQNEVKNFEERRANVEALLSKFKDKKSQITVPLLQYLKFKQKKFNDDLSFVNSMTQGSRDEHDDYYKTKTEEFNDKLVERVKSKEFNDNFVDYIKSKDFDDATKLEFLNTELIVSMFLSVKVEGNQEAKGILTRQ